MSRYELRDESDNVVNVIVLSDEQSWPVPDGHSLVKIEDVAENRVALTNLQFREKFTMSEKVAIYSAANSVVEIKIWLDDLGAAQEVFLDDPRTIAGVQYLEVSGLISEGRAAEILGSA